MFRAHKSANAKQPVERRLENRKAIAEEPEQVALLPVPFRRYWRGRDAQRCRESGLVVSDSLESVRDRVPSPGEVSVKDFGCLGASGDGPVRRLIKASREVLRRDDTVQR